MKTEYGILDRGCLRICKYIDKIIRFLPYLSRTIHQEITDNKLNISLLMSRECPWARHFRAQPTTVETQESMNNVSCRDMTEILLKAA